MVVSTDPNVRKGSMGVIALWFVFCIINMIITSINAGRKGDTSTGSSSSSGSSSI